MSIAFSDPFTIHGIATRVGENTSATCSRSRFWPQLSFGVALSLAHSNSETDIEYANQGLLWSPEVAFFFKCITTRPFLSWCKRSKKEKMSDQHVSNRLTPQLELALLLFIFWLFSRCWIDQTLYFGFANTYTNEYFSYVNTIRQLFIGYR